jgi:hypothetical protein
MIDFCEVLERIKDVLSSGVNGNRVLDLCCRSIAA